VPDSPVPGPGDYNGDGTVDAADYVVWRKTGDSPVDYNTWRANFGQTAGSGTGIGLTFIAAVPEPSALIVLLTGILALFCCRARP
jgi:hypothetical protein